MVTIISISLALLVIVAGLLLLAKTKKEELGGLFTFASYAIITCGILLSVHAFVGCMINCHSRGGGCEKGSFYKCHGSAQGGSECATYGKGCCKSKHGAESACKKDSKSCKKSTKGCSASEGKKTEVSKIIIKETDGNKGADAKK